jgi:hypothetical protein
MRTYIHAYAHTHTHPHTHTQEGVPGEVEQNFETAIAFIRRAAEKGDPESMHMMAVVSIVCMCCVLRRAAARSQWCVYVHVQCV